MSKYIQYFETLEDSEGFIIEAPFSGYVNNLPIGIFSLKNGIINNGEVCGHRIYYTSNDNNVITPYEANGFGASIMSNIYDNVGILEFDGLFTGIGAHAFYNCSSLTSITIPNSVTSIGEDAFYGCSGLTSVTIPNSVTWIGWCAFSGCTSLSSVTIGNNVTSIGRSAFYNCSSLTSIVIPDSVTSIGYLAFSDCTSLTSVVVAEGNTVYDSRENCNAIIETATNTLIIGCQNTIIPDSVTSIGDGTFFECSSLTSITIPDSVTSIGERAFWDCSSLTSIVIGNSVTSIGDYTFEYCSSLTSIVIPDSVTSIGHGAFAGCSSLTSIVIPDSVTSIGYAAFYFCSSLTTITCEATTPPTLGSYNNLPNVTSVYVPAESVDLYKTATNWSYYSGVIKPIE